MTVVAGRLRGKMVSVKDCRVYERPNRSRRIDHGVESIAKNVRSGVGIFRKRRAGPSIRCSATRGKTAWSLLPSVDRACELGDGLTRRLLEERLGADDAADPGARVDCPICGGPVHCEAPDTVETETREVLTRRGKVQYERAARRSATNTWNV